MRIIQILATMLLLASTSAHADSQLLPAFYKVTGVASNDVLNVRSGTGTSHPIIEYLAYNDRHIEIVRLSDDRKWGLIGYPGGSGWASMRYLKRQSGQSASNLPQPLSCGGNEPFWNLTFSQNGNRFTEPGQVAHNLATTWQGTPAGMRPISYGVKMAGGNDAISAVISRRQCSDGMSDKAYGFTINALLSGGVGNRMLAGCCALKRP